MYKKTGIIRFLETDFLFEFINSSNCLSSCQRKSPQPAIFIYVVDLCVDEEEFIIFWLLYFFLLNFPKNNIFILQIPKILINSITQDLT